jgi:hypothetical protein
MASRRNHVYYTEPHGTHVVPRSLLHFVTHISRPFACFLPLFALQLEGARRQTEPPSRHMRLALRSTRSLILILSFWFFYLCPPGLTRATQPRYMGLL